MKGGRGDQIGPPPTLEKTTLKKPSLIRVKKIKRLKSLQVKAEAYRASTMEVLVNIFNGLLFSQ